MNIKIIFILLILFVGIVGTFIFFGKYPVAIVDWKIITAKKFNEHYAASLNYYAEAQKVYGGDSQTLQSEKTRMEIKRALLDSLIEDILIDKKLREELSRSDLNRLVANKISMIKRSENMEKSVAILYGFSYDIFKKEVLEPMAKKEILEGRFYLNGKNIEDYLKEAREKVKIIILLPGFDWNGKEVIIK